MKVSFEASFARDLKGIKDKALLERGDYRIGIEVLEDRVIFVRILHRKDIYRYFP